MAAGVISFAGGALGNAAGEGLHAQMTTGDFRNVDEGLVKRSLTAGVINVAAFGFSGTLKYADEGIDAFNKSRKLSGIVKSAFKGPLKYRNADVASIFGTIHFSIQGTLMAEMKPNNKPR